ncbi:MAG: hypothetical protein ACYTF1_24085 [Planctomycetota bacterium]|jgi:hypothetical protein
MQLKNTHRVLVKGIGLIIVLVLIAQILSIALFYNIYHHIADTTWDFLDRLMPNQTTNNLFLNLIVQCLTLSLPIIVISLVTYYFIVRRYRPKWLCDGETRCRKCQYILRGISEPRCPECGERI